MDDLTDPDDHMEPDELIEEASNHLLSALAILDGMRRLLHGHAEPPRQGPLNVALLSARPRCLAQERKAGPVPPSPGGRGGDGRGGQGVRSTKRPRKQRPPFPRRVE